MTRIRLTVAALSVAIASSFPSALAQAPTPNTKTEPVATQTRVRTEVKLPTLPINALTPADKNYGGTSIYLIDKKAQEKKKKIQVVAPAKGKPLTPKPTPAPKDAIIIESGADTSDKHLAPQGFHQGSEEHLVPAIYIRQPVPEKKVLRPVALKGSTTAALYIIRTDQQRSDFYAFTDDGQSIQNDVLGGGAPIAVGSRGTVLSTGEGILALHAGDVLIDTGNQPVRLVNREAGIKIPPQSTVLINYAPGISMRIVTLASESGGTVKARAAANQDKGFELATGEGLLLDLEGVNQKKFAMNELVQSSTLLQNSAPALRKHDRLRAHIGKVVLSDTGGAKKGSGTPARVLAAEGSEFLVDAQGELVLTGGWLCTEAGPGSVLSSNMGKVFLTKNAFVSLEQVPGYFRIASCSGPGAVVATFNKFQVPLERGEEVLFTDHQPQSDELAAGDGILRRNLRWANLGEGKHAVLGEFSIYSLLYNAAQLKPLRLAATRGDKLSRDKLIRTLALVQFSTGSRPDYTDVPSAEAVKQK